MALQKFLDIKMKQDQEKYFRKAPIRFYSYIKWLNSFGLCSWEDSCSVCFGQYTTLKAFAVLVLHLIFSGLRSRGIKSWGSKENQTR